MRRKGAWLALAAGLVLSSAGWGPLAWAQDRTVTHGTPAGPVQNPGASSVQMEDHRSPALAEQMIRMLKGGVAPDVVQKFVESWTTPFLTSAQDLEHLRAAGASARLLDAYAKRGAQLRWGAHLQSSEKGERNEKPRVLVVPLPTPRASQPWWSAPSPGPPLYLFSEELPWAAEAYAQQYEWASGYFGPEFWWPLWR